MGVNVETHQFLIRRDLCCSEEKRRGDPPVFRAVLRVLELRKPRAPLCALDPPSRAASIALRVGARGPSERVESVILLRTPPARLRPPR